MHACVPCAICSPQSPQSPIARTDTYDDFDMDCYPTGTNAIVAVLAYTGCVIETNSDLLHASCDISPILLHTLAQVICSISPSRHELT